MIYQWSKEDLQNEALRLDNEAELRMDNGNYAGGQVYAARALIYATLALSVKEEGGISQGA